MKTLAGFHSIRPGTWFFPSFLFAHALKEEAVIRPTPLTLEEVPKGCLFTANHAGSPHPFLKLRGEHWIGDSLRDLPRRIDVILCQTGEPMSLEPNTRVWNARAPRRDYCRKLRKTFFERIGNQVIRINIVREEADAAENPNSLSGTFEFFTDPPAS